MQQMEVSVVSKKNQLAGRKILSFVKEKWNYRMMGMEKSLPSFPSPTSCLEQVNMSQTCRTLRC